MTTIICPHCNGAVSVEIQAYKGKKFAAVSAQDLIRLLNKDSRRDVYACQGGGYAMSYQGGTVNPDAITEAINHGWIKEKWPERKVECWILTRATDN